MGGIDSSPFTNSRRVLTTPRFAVKSRWSPRGKWLATGGDAPHAVVDRTTATRPTKRASRKRLPGRTRWSEPARGDLARRVDCDHRSLALAGQDCRAPALALD